jgi:hypothetical protein
MPPELAQMQMASALAPQILAQQQVGYYKNVLQILTALIKKVMQAQGVGPKAIKSMAGGITNLDSAMNQLDKERPEQAAPVQSLLANSLMQRPQMGGPSAGPVGLPVMQ